MSLKYKSISIMLGSVMLVIFTLAISVIIYQWVSEYARDITKEAEGKRESTLDYHNYDLITCSRARLSLESTSFPGNTNGSIVEEFLNENKIDYYENITVNTTIGKIYLASSSTQTYYKQEINLSNENSIDLWNYQVKIIYDTQSLISQGKMRSDCRDIRVIDKNNNPLDFWLWKYSCNTPKTEIFVKMPYLPANQNTTIYIIFGDNLDFKYGSYKNVFVNSYMDEDMHFSVIWKNSIGGYHSCALLNNGSVVCWGDNFIGQLGDGTNTDRWLPVFVKDPSGNGILENVTQVVLGGYHTCALLSNGSVVCWGWNDYGQIGDGTTKTTSLPVFVKDWSNSSVLENVTQITASYGTTCALLNNGSVVCWGWNSDGNLGDGTTTHRNLPVFVRDWSNSSVLGNVSSVVSGGEHTCALLNNGSVVCWGWNAYGQIGDGTTTTRYVPVFVRDWSNSSVLENVTQVAGGGYHTCALLNNGSVVCWGYNLYGQLGEGGTKDKLLPVFVRDWSNSSVLENVTQVAGGGYHTCALLNNGSVVCWGWNIEGNLGDGSIEDKFLPVFVKDWSNSSVLENVTQVALGERHSCALLSNGSIMCWGRNGDGELGYGLAGSIFTFPVFVKDSSGNKILDNVNNTDVGWSHSCSSLNNGSVVCWGYNYYGQLGDGTNITRWFPVFVREWSNSSVLENVTQVGLGWYHTCAVLSNGSVVCWGWNAYGQIGDGTTTTRYVPVFVRDWSNSSVLENVTQVGLGWSHSCALLSNGSVVCWGDNSYGQLGDGTNADSNIPVFVKDWSNSGVLENVTQVAGGGYHTCAVLSNGSVVCWGYNYYGELGNGKKGTGTNSNLPVFVRDWSNSSVLENATRIDLGLYHSCALLNNGSVVCWGYNINGQLGDGTNTDSNIPVFVKDWSNSSVLENATRIGLGHRHSCAVLSNGSVVCWGINSGAQLGDGTTKTTSLPVFVKDWSNSSVLENATQVAGGGYHTCATHTTGTVSCWGSNGLGRLGIGDHTIRTVPIKVKDYELNASLNKTSGIYSITNSIKDIWFLISKRYGIKEIIQYNLSLTPPSAGYYETSLLQTLNLLSFNSTKVDRLWSIVFKIDNLPNLVEIFISEDNTTYKKIALDSSYKYVFTSAEQSWKSLYLRLVLNSTIAQDDTPVVDNYIITYETLPDENIKILVFNPTDLNLTLTKITLIDKETKDYCEITPSPYYIDAYKMERYAFQNCTLTCEKDNIELIISTECGSYRFGVVC